MPQVDLDEVEAYLMKQAEDAVIVRFPDGLYDWVRDRFAELRARERTKTQQTQAVSKKTEAYADMVG